MFCDNCGLQVSDDERGSLIVTSVANENQGDSVDSKILNKDLCKECALQLQHDIFHMIYDL